MTLERVSHRFFPGTPRETVALEGVDLELAPGEFLALVGCTGSGKTTLLRHLNAQLRPTAGRVRWDGKALPADAVRRRVALAEQFPEDALFADTVAEDVAFGPRNLGLSAPQVADRVRRALARVGLGEEHARRSPFALSGGERRRAALAGVLAMEPELVCLDEPTAGLDWRGCGEVLELLARLNREEGVGVVLVTHRMEEALRFAHRVALLRSGRLVLAGDPETVLARPDLLRRCGLEVPPVVRVQELLIRRGLALASPALDAAAAAQRNLRALEVG